MTILRRLTHLTSWRRDIPFLLNHLGLFLAMTTATLGNADMQRLRMITVVYTMNMANKIHIIGEISLILPVAIFPPTQV